MTTWTEARPHPDSELAEIDRLLARLGLGMSDPDQHGARRAWFVKNALSQLIRVRENLLERHQNEGPPPSMLGRGSDRGPESFTARLLEDPSVNVARMWCNGVEIPRERWPAFGLDDQGNEDSEKGVTP